MFYANREISIYELLNGKGARWYWDTLYITEVELEQMQPPVCPGVLREIDRALERRAGKMEPETSELWLLGINDEYCWSHDPGGWDCARCRCMLTLPLFFARVAMIAAILEKRKTP